MISPGKPAGDSVRSKGQICSSTINSLPGGSSHAPTTGCTISGSGSHVLLASAGVPPSHGTSVPACTLRFRELESEIKSLTREIASRDAQLASSKTPLGTSSATLTGVTNSVSGTIHPVAISRGPISTSTSWNDRRTPGNNRHPSRKEMASSATSITSGSVHSYSDSVSSAVPSITSSALGSALLSPHHLHPHHQHSSSQTVGQTPMSQTASLLLLEQQKLAELATRLGILQEENQRLTITLKDEDKMKQELMTAYHSSLKEITELNGEVSLPSYSKLSNKKLC
ncbi:unnamed protein product [Protopolystoma xenopodis]|uniref:Uncharacterized protein n=1 Tax=Protopolystoma xenopodis TaxID=117903 RepID=A0A448WBR9_9PLAT|nr:unnamed protein product [Protopolystoma xenopodis]